MPPTNNQNQTPTQGPGTQAQTGQSVQNGQQSQTSQGFTQSNTAKILAETTTVVATAGVLTGLITTIKNLFKK